MKDPKRLIFTEEPHGYTLDGFPIPSQSAVLEGAGYTPPWGSVPKNVIAYAGWRGNVFHAATLAVEAGTPVEIPDELYEDLSHRLREFERFLGDHSPVLLGSEESGWNEDLYCAGTWDRVYEFPTINENSPHKNRLRRIDIKTSSKPSPWWAIQLAIYNLLDDRPTAVDRFALWFPKGGKYRLIPAKELSGQGTLEDYADAIAAAKAYHYRVRHGIIEGITHPKRNAATEGPLVYEAPKADEEEVPF